MNDELPTAERLRRIERGVERRIDARRATRQGFVRGVTGVAVVALVLGGGFALLRSQSGSAGSTSAAGSAASPIPSIALTVECHGVRTVTARVDPTGLPAAALAACARLERGSMTANRPASGTSDGSAASTSPTAGTLCETAHGDLHVYPGLPAVCATHGMHPYAG